MELRELPSVDALSRTPELAKYVEGIRIQAARTAIEAARERLREGKPEGDLAASASVIAAKLSTPSLDQVINASGVVLHTGLGRARLAPSVAVHVGKVASGYCALEFDLETGERGDRQAHVRDLLCRLTGADDALVVNNAAAGVLLTLTALAGGGDVLLSRGEMVEIGGSFRMPEIVSQSGCRLVEVGCTNKTHLRDYDEALRFESTILRCHPSNYRIVGFTANPSLDDLRELADSRSSWLIDDQGSGLLVDARSLGLPAQPTLPESAKHAHVSIASGDKLMGGPQAGIIVGQKRAIDQIRNHPIARAVRIDKLNLAALEATLRLWVHGEEGEIPAIRYLRRSQDEVRGFADRLAAAWGLGATVESGQTEAGSGSAPGTGVPTWRVRLATTKADELAKKLRTGSPAIVPYIERGSVRLDPRTMDDDEVSVAELRLSELTR